MSVLFMELAASGLRFWGLGFRVSDPGSVSTLQAAVSHEATQSYSTTRRSTRIVAPCFSQAIRST